MRCIYNEMEKRDRSSYERIINTQTVKAVYFDIGPFQTDNVLNSHQKLNIEMKTKIVKRCWLYMRAQTMSI